VLDRPALGVLGVQRLVKCDTEAAQDRALFEPARGDRGPRSEQRVRVQVDGPRVDLDVTGVRQARADQSPHRIQALEHLRPVVGEVLEDRVQPASLRGRPVQLLHEHRRPARGSGGGLHEVTARG
jgi:hypothetical protein